MAASEADGCAGVGDALGRLVGRTRVGKTGRVGRPVGLAGVGRAGQGGLRGLHPFSSFSILFFISSLLFEFEFGLELESQFGAPNLLEF